MASRIASPLDESEHQLLSRPVSGKRYRASHDRFGLNRRLSAIPPSKRQKTVNGNSHRPLRRVSKGLKAEQAKYRKVSAIFLALPENKWCICCTLRREKLSENILRNQAVEIHHWAGRIGRLLCFVPFFRAFCNACRRWPHDNPEKARTPEPPRPGPAVECFSRKVLTLPQFL